MSISRAEASWYENKSSKRSQNQIEMPFYTWTFASKKDQDEETN